MGSNEIIESLYCTPVTHLATNQLFLQFEKKKEARLE